MAHAETYGEYWRRKGNDHYANAYNGVKKMGLHTDLDSALAGYFPNKGQVNKRTLSQLLSQCGLLWNAGDRQRQAIEQFCRILKIT